MGFFDDVISGVGSFFSDGYNSISSGISSLWDEPTFDSTLSKIDSLGDGLDGLGTDGFKIPESTPSFWDSVKSEFLTPSSLGNIAKYGYSAYAGSQAADKQDKLLEAQQQEKRDANELARLNILLQMEKEKYNLAAKGASGSGGGADRQIQMINALNQSANMRITALNNLSSGYIMATRGGR